MTYQTIGSMLDELAELRKVSALVRELLAILETVEETDDGREFHPTTISSCRCMTAKRLDEIFTELKASLSNKQARGSGWWCEHCQKFVEPECVTYDETHDTRAGGCGGYVHANLPNTKLTGSSASGPAKGSA